MIYAKAYFLYQYRILGIHLYVYRLLSLTAHPIEQRKKNQQIDLFYSLKVKSTNKKKILTQFIF